MIERKPQACGKTVIVLGAGIAGLAAAEALMRSGMHIIVVEQRMQAGGTHRSHQIGPYTFDVGSIFYEPTARLFAMAPGLREICPTVQRQQRRIAPGGRILHYPVEPREFLRAPRLELARDMLDLLWSRHAVRRNGTLAAICRQRLGGRIFASTGLEAYISRFNHVPPEDVCESFFFHRMAFIERMTRMANLFKLGTRAVFSGPSISGRQRPLLHVRPREGFDAIFTPITQRLQAHGVRFEFGQCLQRILREGPLLKVETDHQPLRAHAVVAAIPLDSVHRALYSKGSALVSLAMTTLFVSAQHLDDRTGNVLFNFDRIGRWKRATIYSRIYPEAAPPRAFLAVECTLPPGEQDTPEAIFADFRCHLEDLGLASDLQLEGYEHLPDCYPLYRPGTGERRDNVLREITRAGIIPVGRQGGFEYLPTSSGVVRRVLEELGTAGLVPADPASLAPSLDEKAQGA